MERENIIRLVAGLMIIISFVLASYVNPNWAFLSLFVAVNLIQSSFTNFCPLEIVLRKLNIGK